VVPLATGATSPIHKPTPPEASTSTRARPAKLSCPSLSSTVSCIMSSASFEAQIAAQTKLYQKLQLGQLDPFSPGCASAAPT